MKKIFIPLLAIAITSFRMPPEKRTAHLPLCTAVEKVMKEEPNEFADLKGKLVSQEGEDQTYELKFSFDGWHSSEWVKSDGAVSVDITSEVSNEETAAALFENTAKQLKSCLDMDGVVANAKGAAKLIIFTKEKNDLGLMLISRKGKNFVLLSISRES